MSIFDFVKSKLSIIDVVLEYVKVKRAGTYWKGSCPFHSETDASFTVSPDKQIYYCFGCQAGGDLISFIAKIENMNQIEAVHHLLEKYNIVIPPDMESEFKKKPDSGKKDQFFHTCNAVAAWTHEQLVKNNFARQYLEKRGIDRLLWQKFTIGYFPGGNRNLAVFLKEMAKKNILVKDLLEAGVVAQGRTSLYSPFEERILFPIRDLLGRGCGFGGRVFQPGDERAKYYNSKESEWFLKGKLLFGLDIAKKDMQQKEKAFLVEGYTDCVMMAKAGYKNVVATLGTACTADHLKTLSRYVKTLYVLYDGDAAGQKAILRLTKLCWEANLDLKIIKLPEKEDPASFVTNGGKIETLVDQAADIFSFFVNSLGEKFWGGSLAEKVKLCDQIIGVVAKINDSFKQDLLLQQAASVTQIPFESLKKLLSNHVRKTGDDESFQTQSAEKKNVSCGKFDSISGIERRIVSLVINSATTDHPLVVGKDLHPYFAEPMRAVLEKIEVFHEGGPRTFDRLLNSFDESMRDWILEQSFMVEEEEPADVLEKLLFRFRKQNWKGIVQDMKNRIVLAKQQNDQEKVAGLLDSFWRLKQEMKERGLI